MAKSEDDKKNLDFDHIISDIGPFGRFQIFHYILLGLSCVTSGFFTLASIFVAATPKFTCKIPSLSVDDTIAFQSVIRPSLEDAKCEKYATNYTELLLTSVWQPGNITDVDVWVDNRTQVVPCQEWIYDRSVFGNTIVMEWNLVCDEAWKKATSTSVFMLGLLFGAVAFGSLADRIGRRRGWFSAVVTLPVVGVIVAFVPNYWAHILLRLVCGALTIGIYTIGFVWAMEMIGPDQRMAAGVWYQGWFSLGYILLAPLAYSLQDFNNLLLALAILSCIPFAFFFVLSESARWLATQKRLSECRSILKKAARWNKKIFSEEDTAMKLHQLENKAEAHLHDKKYTILDLFRLPNMRKKSLGIFFNWFTNSFVYYGLTLGSTDLVGSPYVNLVFSGLAELAAFIVVVLVLDRLGRRWPLALFLGFSGLCCLIQAVVPSNAKYVILAFAMLGKLAISGSFGIIYLYSVELFPTVVRTTGLGASSTCARVGGLVAPFVADLGSYSWKSLPSLVFGSCALLGGALTLLLPETLHQTLPDTLQEGEEFGKKKKRCGLNEHEDTDETEAMNNSHVA